MFSKKVILGSASPRRKQLIESLGFPCEVRKKEVEEIYDNSLKVESVPVYLAKCKAMPLKENIQEGEVLLTSDTVVILEGKILGKPKDRADAISMLQQLSGKTHKVVSGVYLFSTTQNQSFSVETKVVFKVLSEAEINYYVDTYQPFDKAGAYGIQEWIGMIGVEKIEGSFYNVMGLPVFKLWEVLNTEF